MDDEDVMADLDARLIAMRIPDITSMLEDNECETSDLEELRINNNFRLSAGLPQRAPSLDDNDDEDDDDLLVIPTKSLFEKR
jgi:hypothetical protein